MFKSPLFARIFSLLSAKLFKINDSAQKIALGVGLGIFAGLLPGTGPAAALFLAFIFRANRAAALFGGLLTNTWLSLVTFILAIKVGSVILKMNWQIAQQRAEALIKDFSWAKLFKFSVLETLLPVVIGYLVLGLILGALGYFLTLLIIRRSFNGDKTAHQ